MARRSILPLRKFPAEALWATGSLTARIAKEEAHADRFISFPIVQLKYVDYNELAEADHDRGRSLNQTSAMSRA